MPRSKGRPFEKGNPGRPKGAKNKWNKVSKAVLAEMIDPDRAIREAARLAYCDIREIYDDAGRMKPIKDWPDDLAAAVGGVEFVRRNVDSADGHTDDVIKVKLWDKPKNIELLFKHLGLLEEKHNVTGELVLRWKDA